MNFGPYTKVHLRADGLARIRFEVPPRLRPEGWPYSKPITLPGRDGIDLEALTAQEHAELRRQAKRHFIDLKTYQADQLELESKRQGNDSAIDDGWSKVLTMRYESEEWAKLAQASQDTYRSVHKGLLRICRARGLTIEATTESQFTKVLREEHKSAWMRKPAYSELRVLVGHAIVENLRPAQLLFRSSARTPESSIRPWDENDVYCLVTAAMQAGEPGLAKLILTQWEVGQRLTSSRNFRYGHQYREGMVIHRCRKTNREVRIPILNPSARKLLDRDYQHGAYMFPRAYDGRPFEMKALTTKFAAIRDKLPDYRGTNLQIRCLRHACILQLARAGCRITEIASITGHSFAWVYETLSSYMGRDEHLARIAMARREKLRLDGIEGEMIIEEARRIFLGPKDPATKPLTPRELALYGE